MKLIITDLDGEFSSDMHVANNIYVESLKPIEWTMPFIPRRDDWFRLENFIDNVPNRLVLECNWKVDWIELTDMETIKISLTCY